MGVTMRTMRSRHVLALLVMIAVCVDFAVLTEGAFRFNIDESMVGARMESGSDTVAIVPAVPRASGGRHGDDPASRPVVRSARIVPPRASLITPRSRLSAAADAERSSDDH